MALAGALGLLYLLAAPALAQGSPGEAGGADPAGLLPAALVLLLPLGLMLLVSSAWPESRAPAAAVTLLAVWAIAAVVYFAAGFAFHFGGIAQVTPQPDLRGLYWEWYPLDQSVPAEVARLWGLVALRGWLLSGEAATPGAFVLFLSHLSLVGVTAMIPAGVLLQRERPGLALLAGLLAGLALYPLPGNWLWGGGWLAHLGASVGWGHGLVDFGGAGPIFLTGGASALVALLLLRRASPAGQAAPAAPPGLESEAATGEEELPVTPMPSAYLPLLGLLGAGLMILGWFGLAAGQHAPTALNFSPPQAAVNGLLAALAAALAAAGYSWFTTREFNPLMTSRGLVAGLVLVTAGAPFIPAWLALAAGGLLGLLFPALVYLFNQGWRLADELGTVATYGLSGLFSLLLVSLFADGRWGQGWNGVGLADYYGVAGQGVSGLVVAPGLAPDWPGQLQAQLLGAGAIALWAMLVSFVLFQAALLFAAAWARAGFEPAEPDYVLPPEPAETEGREDAATA
jgi:ammonium transporter, Amt family